MTLDELAEAAVSDLKACRKESQVQETLRTLDRLLASRAMGLGEMQAFWKKLGSTMGSVRSFREAQSGSSLNDLYAYATAQIKEREQHVQELRRPKKR
jgi:hypothetical protein